VTLATEPGKPTHTVRLPPRTTAGTGVRRKQTAVRGQSITSKTVLDGSSFVGDGETFNILLHLSAMAFAVLIFLSNPENDPFGVSKLELNYCRIYL
jgi:hypothetical protein